MLKGRTGIREVKNPGGKYQPFGEEPAVSDRQGRLTGTTGRLPLLKKVVLPVD